MTILKSIKNKHISYHWFINLFVNDIDITCIVIAYIAYTNKSTEIAFIPSFIFTHCSITAGYRVGRQKQLYF